MANITDPEAVRFVNEVVRPLATQLVDTYRQCAQASTEWTANPQLATLIAYDNSDPVIDGAADDGRHQATGVNVNNVLTRAGEFMSDLEAETNAKLNTLLALSHPGH